MDIISNSSISSLQLDLNFGHLIGPLPRHLKTLILTEIEEGIELNDLPASLTRLQLTQQARVRPASNLPASLTHLLLFSCEQPINQLPPNITHLSFNSHFNQAITGKLPQTLQSLELGCSFSQPLRSLPPSLKSLFR